MVVNRRRRIAKLRGSRYCGFGPNRHRGAGQRGGRGNAGTGKKCHAKKPSVWQAHLGSKGFSSRDTGAQCCMNIRDLEDKLPQLLGQEGVAKEGDVFVVDLQKLGVSKLLSAGRVHHKMKVTVAAASAKVEEKLKAAGGELVKA